MIKIGLDTAALERLIGGDTEVEVKLRQGVVEEFTKRHLLKVLRDECFAAFLAREAKTLQDALGAEMQRHVVEQVGQVKHGAWGGVTVTLHEALRADMAAKAKVLVDDTVRKAVADAWAEREKRLTAEIANAINQRVHQLTEDLVRKLVQERLSAITLGLQRRAEDRAP